MMHPDTLRQMATKIENARAKARLLLAREWTDTDKIKFFDKVYPVAKEFLEECIKDGHASNYTGEEFRPRVLCAAFGDDFYKWMYELGGD